MWPVICVNKIWRTWRSLFDSAKSSSVCFWPCCPHCVLTVLSTLCCSDRVIYTVLFWPCCLHCVVLTVQSTVLMFLFCFWPCCPHCVVLTVLSTLCCSDRVVHTVLLFLFCFWPCCPHCVVLTVLSIQGYKYIHSPVTLKYTQHTVHWQNINRQNITISQA